MNESTSTIIANLGEKINLDEAFKEINKMLTFKKINHSISKYIDYNCIYFCSHKDKWVGVKSKDKTKKKKNNFNSQISINYIINGKNNNLMIFGSGILKLTGVMTNDNVPLIFSFVKKLLNLSNNIVILEYVMKNFDYILPFKINKKKLNLLFNELGYLSIYEPTSQIHVKLILENKKVYENKYLLDINTLKLKTMKKIYIKKDIFFFFYENSFKISSNCYDLPLKYSEKIIKIILDNKNKIEVNI